MGSGGDIAFLAQALEQAGQRAQRAEVLRADRAQRHADAEVLLDEAQQLGDAEGVEDPPLQQRRVGLELGPPFEMALDDVGPQRVGDVHATPSLAQRAASARRSTLPLRVRGSSSTLRSSWTIMERGSRSAQCRLRSRIEISARGT